MDGGHVDEAYPRIRLHVEPRLTAGAEIEIAREQAHYLMRVMRLGAGAAVAVFNGRDGEWRATVAAVGKRGCTLAVEAPLRPQASVPDLWLLFAPVKRQPLDWMVQKATEMGVALLQPVMTRRTVVDRVNLDRLHAIAIEAAEQSERLDVPEIREPRGLMDVLEGWPEGRRLAVCDETGRAAPAAEALRQAGAGPWALLLGPEGGFAPAELDALRDLAFVTPISLGPRVLRAETAAVAALAIWQATFGDWSGIPPGRGGDKR